MSDVLTWAQIGTIIAGGGVVLTAWKIRQADLRALDSKIGDIDKSLTAFKLHVAELHPTAKELVNVETRLSASLDRLSDRIDRLLERAS